MGIIGKYIRTHISTKLVPVKLGFDNVSKDILSLRQHVSHLNNHTTEWHSYLHQKSVDLEKNLHDFRDKIDDNMSRKVSGFIDKMEDEVQDLKEEVAKRDERQDILDDVVALKKDLTHVFQQYNKHIVHLHNKIHGFEKEREQLKTFVREEMKKMVPPAPLTIPERKSEVKDVIEPKPVFSLKDLASRLTPAQKSIIATLASTGQKLSYKDIAIEHAKSPSTVKTQICYLRKAGVPVHESTIDGMKRFYLDKNFKKILLSKQL